MKAKQTLPGFERFWSAFGNKVARPIAFRAWVKNECEDIADEIITAIGAYNRHLAANPWKARMHPSTYLNQARWQDEYPESKPATNPMLQTRFQSRDEYLRASIERNRRDLDEPVNENMRDRLKAAGIM